MRLTSTLTVALAALVVLARSAHADPTIVQNPSLPPATASLTATLDGGVYTPSLLVGGIEVAGPITVLVPPDGTTKLSATGSTTDAFTPFDVPSVNSNASAEVDEVTSSGSAVDHASGVTTLIYRLQIIATGPIANPPTQVPVIFTSHLSAPPPPLFQGGASASASVKNSSFASRFSATISSAQVPPTVTISQTRNIVVNDLHSVELTSSTEAYVQNATSVPPMAVSTSAAADLGFAFDQAEFDTVRAGAGLPTFDLESAYRIEVSPPLIASTGGNPQVPLVGPLGSIALAGLLLGIGSRSRRAVSASRRSRKPPPAPQPST
jgi:hypothetical protein